MTHYAILITNIRAEIPGRLKEDYKREKIKCSIISVVTTNEFYWCLNMSVAQK